MDYYFYVLLRKYKISSKYFYIFQSFIQLINIFWRYFFVILVLKF